MRNRAQLPGTPASLSTLPSSSSRRNPLQEATTHGAGVLLMRRQGTTREVRTRAETRSTFFAGTVPDLQPPGQALHWSGLPSSLSFSLLSLLPYPSSSVLVHLSFCLSKRVSVHLALCRPFLSPLGFSLPLSLSLALFPFDSTLISLGLSSQGWSLICSFPTLYCCGASESNRLKFTSRFHPFLAI